MNFTGLGVGYWGGGGVGGWDGVCLRMVGGRGLRGRGGGRFLGLRRGRYFCSPDHSGGNSTLAAEIGFRFSVVGLVRPVFYLRRRAGTAGLGRSSNEDMSNA